MALNIYILGNPHGFVTNCKDANRQYIERLYVTYHTGHRLLVNRRNDGSTAYNFLVYGINGQRPNSFFGMTFMLTDNLYVADFNAVYNIFKRVFDALCSRSDGFLATLPDGRLKYVVQSFDDAPQCTQWLINAIGKELYESGLQFASYDSSFNDNNSGSVLLYNNSTPAQKILEGFRSARWVAVSPLFAMPADNAPESEINVPDIKEGYTKYLKLLSDIAFNPAGSTLAQVEDIASYALNTKNELVKYLLKLRSFAGINQNDIDSLKELSDSFDDLYDKALTLSRRYPGNSSEPVSGSTPETERDAQPDAESDAGPDIDLTARKAPKRDKKPGRNISLKPALKFGDIFRKSHVQALFILAGILCGVIWALRQCSSNEEAFNREQFITALDSGDYEFCHDMLSKNDDVSARMDMCNRVINKINSFNNTADLNTFYSSTQNKCLFRNGYDDIDKSFARRMHDLKTVGSVPINADSLSLNRSEEPVTQVAAATQVSAQVNPRELSPVEKIFESRSDAVILIYGGDINYRYDASSPQLIVKTSDNEINVPVPASDKSLIIVPRSKDYTFHYDFYQRNISKRDDGSLRVVNRTSDKKLTVKYAGKEYVIKFVN